MLPELCSVFACLSVRINLCLSNNILLKLTLTYLLYSSFIFYYLIIVISLFLCTCIWFLSLMSWSYGTFSEWQTTFVSPTHLLCITPQTTTSAPECWSLHRPKLDRLAFRLKTSMKLLTLYGHVYSEWSQPFVCNTYILLHGNQS